MLFSDSVGVQPDCGSVEQVMSAPFDLARPHGKQRLAAIECLNLAFLVDAQHQRPFRWRHIKPYDITHFFDKGRIGRNAIPRESTVEKRKGIQLN